MEVKKGDNIKVHYVGTLENGTEFDNSYKRGQTLDFEVGSGQLIKGFDNGVMGMTTGEKKTITIPASEGYGEHNPEAIQVTEKSVFPDDFDFKIGTRVNGTNMMGLPISAVIKEVNQDDVVLDFNHELAGKDLVFDIEVVEIN